MAGFDLVFSPPKSVSLLHALGDEETRRAVNEAHLSAWQAALAYLEDEACVTRRGRNGVHREHAGGFVAAAYQHRTSRAQDPHLHTHVIVANMAQTPSDGKWRALDGEPILKSYRLAAGYLYQAQLRAELTRTLGVEWEEPRKGMAELAHVPRPVIREFSTRRRQVIEELARGGQERLLRSPGRGARDPRTKGAPRPDRAARGLARTGRRARTRYPRTRRRCSAGSHTRSRRARNCCAIAGRMLGPQGLTEKQTAFSDPEAVMAWAQAHRGGATADRVRRLAARLIRTDGVQPVGEASEPGKASPLLDDRARRYRDRGARTGRARPRGGSTRRSRAERLEAIERADGIVLSAEQEAMVREVATSPSRVICVVGLAGAGKTTATHAVGQVFRQAGIAVIGAAPSGVAAEKLQDETGIPSTTLHRLLDEARNGDGLPRGSVLVVDEAAMAETRILAPVLDLVEQARREGDPDRRPASAPSSWRGRALRRHRRARGRGRADREPTAAR